MWALGCVAFTMVVGHRPFGGTEALKQVSRGIPQRELIKAKVSSQGRELIEHMTSVDRSRRFTASHVLNHPWIVAPPSQEHHKATRLKTVEAKSYSEVRRKWVVIVTAIRFGIRLHRAVQSSEESENSFIMACPPRLRKFTSRRSTETSSALSNFETRNQLLTLDGCAQRVRSEHRSEETSPLFRYRSTTQATSSGFGFAGVGISSSLAGQLSELGEPDSREAAQVRPPGPFLAALEAHLEAEAGMSSEEEEGEEDTQDGYTTHSSLPKLHAKEDNSHRFTSESLGTQGTLEEEEEESTSPETARESAVRAWQQLKAEEEEEINGKVSSA